MLYQITCATCGTSAAKKRSDGKPPLFCSRECWRAHEREQGKQARYSSNYWTVHTRVRRERGPAKTRNCEHCSAQAHDWAIIHGKDGTDPADYMPLCRGCHIRYDRTDATRAKLAVASTRRERDQHGRFT
jgi:hypothetical protein